MKNLASIEINAAGGGESLGHFKEYCTYYDSGNLVPEGYSESDMSCSKIDDYTNSCDLSEAENNHSIISCFEDGTIYYATNGTHYKRRVNGMESVIRKD